MCWVKVTKAAIVRVQFRQTVNCLLHLEILFFITIPPILKLRILDLFGESGKIGHSEGSVSDGQLCRLNYSSLTSQLS